MALLANVQKLQSEAIGDYYEFAKNKLFNEIRKDPYGTRFFLRLGISIETINEVIRRFNEDGISAKQDYINVGLDVEFGILVDIPKVPNSFSQKISLFS